MSLHACLADSDNGPAACRRAPGGAESVQSPYGLLPGFGPARGAKNQPIQEKTTRSISDNKPAKIIVADRTR